MEGLIFKVNGDVLECTPKNGTDYTLKELQEIVGGLIEIIHLDDAQGVLMVVNEEGKFTKDRNNNATIIAKTYGAIWSNDYISGDVLVCPQSMIK